MAKATAAQIRDHARTADVLRRCFAFVAMVSFASVCPLAVCATPALPEESAPPVPCDSPAPDLPNDLLTAFAYDLESPAILHFISALATLPQRRQKDVFNAAVAAASSPDERDVESSISAACSNLDEIYGAARASYLVVNQWQLKDLSDSKRFGDFSAVVATAISALSLGATLSDARRQAALLPFAALAASDPSPAPSPSPGICASPDRPAHTLHIVEPNYPPLAVSAGIGGSIRLKVALSDTGDVRSVRVRSDTLNGSLGSQDIMRASVYSAAATTYAPETKNCIAARGTYLFRADYRRK